LIKPSRCQFSGIFFISGVAASVSEWQLIHSLTLAATTRSNRSKLPDGGLLNQLVFGVGVGAHFKT